MNDAEKLKLEALLRQVGPLVARLADPPAGQPDRLRAAFDQVLNEEFPQVRELTEKQMEALLLKLIGEQPADGFELITSLGKAHFKLKGVGEGAVYGLLAKLEENGLVEGRWRESSAAMKKSYYLTDSGTRLLKRELASAGELQGWANLVLGRG